MVDRSKDIRIDLESKVWGPKAWFFIDSVCLSYPLNPTQLEKQQYKNFFNSFPIILPCGKCRIHFNEYIIKHPLDDTVLSSKDNLIRWILNAHNNIRINNPIKLEEYYSYYNNKYNIDVKKDTCKSTCGLKHPLQDNNIDDNKYKFISIILFGIIIAISLYLFRINQKLIVG
jgi:hypothetical protein